MGMTYRAPTGFNPTPVIENIDVTYDYSILSADKKIEMRFALRPYSKDMPEPMRTEDFSWTFFQTGIFNLIRGGKTGKAAPAEAVPVDHFGADDAKLVLIRWFNENTDSRAFGNGFELAAVVFIHRDGVGDAYTFVLLKDRAAMENLNEELMHSLHFAPTLESMDDKRPDWANAVVVLSRSKRLPRYPSLILATGSLGLGDAGGV